MTQRRAPGRRSPQANEFYPQHAPRPEAPYIYTPTPDDIAQAQYLMDMSQTEADVEQKLARRMMITKRTHAETTALVQRDKRQRQQLVQAAKKELWEEKTRRIQDRAQREDRWTRKTENDHPFSVDLWQEDEQIYVNNTCRNSKTEARQKHEEKSTTKERLSICKKAIDEVDVLGNLRRERKQLQIDQKDLKARLDLDRVDKNCARAQAQADAKAEAHQKRLAAKGQLDRMASDVFMQPRLSPQERETGISNPTGQRKLGRSLSESFRPRSFGSTLSLKSGTVTPSQLVNEPIRKELRDLFYRGTKAPAERTDEEDVLRNAMKGQQQPSSSNNLSPSQQQSAEGSENQPAQRAGSKELLRRFSKQIASSEMEEVIRNSKRLPTPDMSPKGSHRPSPRPEEEAEDKPDKILQRKASKQLLRRFSREMASGNDS